MAPFGKLYAYQDHARSIGIIAVAKANGLELELDRTVPWEGCPEGYEKKNKLKKIPTFEGADGFVLTESIAIAIYVASQNEKTTLLGKTKQDYATILNWMSFFNHELLGSVWQWALPHMGFAPYNKKSVEEQAKVALKTVDVVEEHLLHHTFLAGERITLADLYCAGIISYVFTAFLDKEWAAGHPNVTRWFETVFNQPILSNIGAKATICEKPLQYTPPKKEAKAGKGKDEGKGKAAPASAEEEEAAAAPKPKHPLEALPKASLPLDEWKRQYSNNETPVALKWFWDNVNLEEYSLWRVDYKYNEELTMVFMTSNLIGGFFARLEASRKYIFGCASVYGQTNDSVIQGAFVVRGQEAMPAFDVAPDIDSYTFTKLDPAKAEDKAFVEDQWTWEKPAVVNGKEYPWADGKVFK